MVVNFQFQGCSAMDAISSSQRSISIGSVLYKGAISGIKYTVTLVV